MTQQELQQRVTDGATAMDVPGVAVGVHLEGEQHYAFHGVTSVEQPLAVDERTLFAIGSTGKTFTATTLMRLVEQGRIDLEERVRAYVPELRLQDEEVAERVRVIDLLNHTSGWEGDQMVDTGEGDDALARYVASMVDLPQVSPLGSEPSYNNAALGLAGHVIERVTGLTYERAVSEMVLEPLGLTRTLFDLNELLTSRVAAGHQQHPDGAITVFRPWSPPRAENPMGGRIASTAADQIAWARFHLGDGRAPSGARLLERETLERMKQQTSGSEHGDRFGIIWMLRDVEGVRFVDHGGASAGQYSGFSMVPERDYAITVLTNSGPNGQELREDLLRWALDAYLGIVVRDPEPLDLREDELAGYAGTYGTAAMCLHVTVDGNRLVFTSEIKPEALAPGEDPEAAAPPPFRVGVVGDERFLILDGPYKGSQGYFVRDGASRASGVHLGRLISRTADAPAEG